MRSLPPQILSAHGESVRQEKLGSRTSIDPGKLATWPRTYTFVNTDIQPDTTHCNTCIHPLPPLQFTIHLTQHYNSTTYDRTGLGILVGEGPSLFVLLLSVDKLAESNKLHASLFFRLILWNRPRWNRWIIFLELENAAENMQISKLKNTIFIFYFFFIFFIYFFLWGWHWNKGWLEWWEKLSSICIPGVCV